jgi:hypothetical protein
MINILMEAIPATPTTREEGTRTGDMPVEIPIFVEMIYQIEDVERLIH